MKKYILILFVILLPLMCIAWTVQDMQKIAITRMNATGPTSQPLLYESDMTYVGSFLIPRVGSGTEADSFDYGGMGFAVSADGLNLYVGGHLYNDSLGIVTIPAPIAGTATLVQAPTAVPGTMGTECGSSEELGAALVYNSRLVVTRRCYYDNDGTGMTHSVGDLDIDNFDDFTRMDNINTAGFVNGYMGYIPSEWQSLLGGPAFSGNSSMSIINKCGNGPSFFVFDPDDVGVESPIPSIPLMYFTTTYPIVADPDAANDIWIRADIEIAGMFFPSGTRSVLFVSRHGTGDRCYGPGCTDPCWPGVQGEHAYPYRRQVTAFDANDLLAVKNGEMEPYEVRPYAWWVLPEEPEGDYCGEMTAAGLAYDPITRRVFLSRHFSSNPIVYVYQLGE